MAGIRIRFQRTPNPNAGKFVIDGGPAGGGPRTFSKADMPPDDPVAAALLALDGVREVFMVSDFITIIKAPDAEWAVLVPAVEAAIRGRG